jgi:hypothetical protein
MDVKEYFRMPGPISLTWHRFLGEIGHLKGRNSYGTTDRRPTAGDHCCSNSDSLVKYRETPSLLRASLGEGLRMPGRICNSRFDDLL